MFYDILHNRWFRIAAAIFSQFVAAIAVNLFLVPLGLYTGGLLGFCQLLRTLLQTYGGLNFGQLDISGILYFIINIPILLFAYKTMGRRSVLVTLVCTVAYSLFASIIPIPTVPIIDDYLTACLLGGILMGVGCGLALTCGGSGGGLDLVGLCLSKQGYNVSVGRFSLGFNFVLYAICLILFTPEVVIYSVIYNVFSALVLDRMHQQNIVVQALIFTQGDEVAISNHIMEKLSRGITIWRGMGAYSRLPSHVLCVCLSKFEIEDLIHAVRSFDPNAFVVVEEGVRVYGNFTHKMD